MRRKLALLNLALLVLTGAAVWQLRLRWSESQVREQRVLRRPAPKVEQPPLPPVPPVQPASASAYGGVAQKMLFSHDRNPNVVLDVKPPKPVPALPVAYGVMDLGDGPTVILSEKPGAVSRGYSLGQKIGDFMLVAYEKDELVLEWEGQQFRRRLQELAPPASAAPAAAPTAKAASAAASATAVSTSTPSGPGRQVTSEMKACVPGDTAPAGTVRDGYRKVVTATPFGQACRWELVK